MPELTERNRHSLSCHYCLSVHEFHICVRPSSSFQRSSDVHEYFPFCSQLCTHMRPCTSNKLDIRNQPLLFNNTAVSMVISLIPCLLLSFFFCAGNLGLCFPSGLCFWVCPTTLISVIYTWTSAAVRYAPLAPAAGTLGFSPDLSHHPPLPSLSPSPAADSGRRRDTGAVSSGLVCGDLGRLR